MIMVKFYQAKCVEKLIEKTYPSLKKQERLLTFIKLALLNHLYTSKKRRANTWLTINELCEVIAYKLLLYILVPFQNFVTICYRTDVTSKSALLNNTLFN